MQVLNENTKFAHLGKPGSNFSNGFARRLNLISSKVDLTNKQILDFGCGLGVWMEQFAKFTAPAKVFGVDVDPELISAATQNSPNIPPANFSVSAGESLPFTKDMFDVVFSNEVMEHVENDVEVAKQIFKVLKPGGIYVFFTPNSGWPFETHGVFLNGKYIWGNIPLLAWLPKFVQRKYAPHVRNYTNAEIKNVLVQAGFKIKLHSYVFPGFDGAVRRFGFAGKLLQKTFFALEKTWFKRFGISHFIVAEK